MTAKQKPHSSKIRSFLADLKRADWLGSARSWWPDFLFHFTDIQNAVSILKEGAVLGRRQCQSLGLMVTDNAGQEIIGQTDEAWKDYARLYFRPRTPTQYRNEGFRPIHQRQSDAHCPVPIYFLFDSYTVLSRLDSLFTDGNLAADPQVFDSAEGLDRIPFDYVYHDSYFPPDTRSSIVFHRHAEVVVPKQLELDSLQFIACRSQAEYETFLHHLLPPSALVRWEGKIGLATRMHLFFKHWAHVESVELNSSRVVFQFKRGPRTPGPFHANVSITDTINDRRFVWDCESFLANESLDLSLNNIGPLWDYSVRLSLGGQIAYADRYQEDLPW